MKGWTVVKESQLARLGVRLAKVAGELSALADGTKPRRRRRRRKNAKVAVKATAPKKEKEPQKSKRSLAQVPE